MTAPGTLPAPDALDATAREVLVAHWRDPGFSVPNAEVYPHQWLWDSCFHAVVWAHLGDDARAVAELENVFAHQGGDGFVPHMTYWHAPQMHADFWGRAGTSAITQPPVHGHAIAELARRGMRVPDRLVDQATRAFAHLFSRRTSPEDLVPIWHPWESGCDDSPRWDAWCAHGWEPLRWRVSKGDMVAALVHDGVAGHGPVANPAFAVRSVAFNALVVFNARELFEVTGDDVLARHADDVAAAIAASYDPARRTWADQGTPPVAGADHDTARGSRVRTLEALFAGAVTTGAEREVASQLLDPAQFAAPYGPTQVHRGEPTYAPDRYWRGAAWPQLTYLWWAWARRRGDDHLAGKLRDALVGGAVRSGFAEYWHPDTAEGLGARPQSWTTLAAVVAAS